MKDKQPTGLTLAIDFDMTVHDKAHPVEGKRMGPPMPGAVEAMENLYDGRHKLIIHTTMATSESGKKAVEDWLDYYSIEYHEVTAVKPNAAVFLDDKAVRFTSWEAAILELQMLGVEVPE